MTTYVGGFYGYFSAVQYLITLALSQAKINSYRFLLSSRRCPCKPLLSMREMKLGGFFKKN